MTEPTLMDGWLMLDAKSDTPYAMMEDGLVLYMAASSGEAPAVCRARIRRVLTEEVTRRDRHEARLHLLASGMGL